MNTNPLPSSPPKPLPQPNPKTQAAHRKEMFWQITLPFGFLLLIFLGLSTAVGWSAVSGSDQVSRWADVALIWQMPLPILLSFLCSLANIVLLVGLIKFIAILPRYTRVLQDYAHKMAQVTRQVSDRLAEPFIKVDSLGTQVRASWQALWKK